MLDSSMFEFLQDVFVVFNHILVNILHFILLPQVRQEGAAGLCNLLVGDEKFPFKKLVVNSLMATVEVNILRFQGLQISFSQGFLKFFKRFSVSSVVSAKLITRMSMDYYILVCNEKSTYRTL